jgi:hypothetical protein
VQIITLLYRLAQSLSRRSVDTGRHVSSDSPFVIWVG